MYLFTKNLVFACVLWCVYGCWFCFWVCVLGLFVCFVVGFNVCVLCVLFAMFGFIVTWWGFRLGFGF